jgi:LDH2 family malate/lactate/ureidoglycolate dehydrogenase
MLTIAPDRLVAVGTTIFSAAGAPADVAEQVARSLVDANLAGHDSHGVLRIPSYVQAIEQGQVRPAERPVVLEEGLTTLLVDGRYGFGQLTARFAMEQAIARAQRTQVAVVATVRTNHIGRLGEWTELAARAGLIGVCTVASGSGRFNVVPHGGLRPALGTNPISFGLPLRGRPPLLLDYATTAIAGGKVMFARDQGVPLPEGLLLDREGRPSTDPEDFFTGGGLLPFAGHKGFALALVVDLLSVALTGADARGEAGRANGAFFLAIDAAAFRSREEYFETAERTVRRIKAVPPAPGFSEVLLPGEPEARSRAERSAGIPVPEGTWSAIEATAARLGVAL